jgi:hypothetical protein
MTGLKPKKIILNPILEPGDTAKCIRCNDITGNEMLERTDNIFIVKDFEIDEKGRKTIEGTLVDAKEYDMYIYRRVILSEEYNDEWIKIS